MGQSHLRQVTSQVLSSLCQRGSGGLFGPDLTISVSLFYGVNNKLITKKKVYTTAQNTLTSLSNAPTADQGPTGNLESNTIMPPRQ
jgi:hypothetical protein